ncbi:unnamed protein product [Symbiodinium sp. CCMP2592]|nr:unnamed protein product [Symbiodinium sp. CCMP2592]
MGIGVPWRRRHVASSGIALAAVSWAAVFVVPLQDRWKALPKGLVQRHGIQHRSPGESFPTRTRLAFDGLDDLEEEEEEPLNETGTVPKDRALIPRPVGSGFQSLEDLYDKHRGTKEVPELEEEELEELHVLLKDEIQRCPSISSVAWAAKALEELELEDDDVFEVIAEKVTDQVDELSPQETLDIVLSFGAIYYNDDELLETLVGAVRRQMKFFTNAEVVRLANAMSRLGGLDDTKHVGMFFEMRKRVNMPLIDKAIRPSDLFMPRAAGCEGNFNRSTCHAVSPLVGPRKSRTPPSMIQSGCRNGRSLHRETP